MIEVEICWAPRSCSELEALISCTSSAVFWMSGTMRESISPALSAISTLVPDICVISPAGKPDKVDHPLYFIRDGVVIIPKNAVVPDGTVI